MENYTRLFDILPYQLAKYPQETAFASKPTKGGDWEKLSTQQCVDTVNQISAAFLKLGLQKDDKVAIISNNRPEWNLVDNGMLQVGVINVPIYPTISESDYKFIFNDAEIKYAFVSDKGLYTKINNIKKDVPSLIDIYSFNEVEGCKNYTDFLKLGEGGDQAEIKAIADTINSAELATIIYTSGTTGTPKGVMLSHDNIVSNVHATLSCLPISDGDRTLSFLPLCHIFERMVTYTYMATGAQIYYAEGMEKIAENIKEVKPQFFSTVPRLLEKVYEKIVEKGGQVTGLKKIIFNWAMKMAMNYKEDQSKGFFFNIADKLVFSKWREALGGELVGCVTGAAALQPRLARVFSAAGIAVREGYGQTETSPVLSFNRFEKGGYKFGSVGVPLPNVEIKLGDRDEILAKGPNIMMGYYKRPDITAETLKDGWIHTGDVGAWDGKFLKITGRVKELFKTSGGKYVAPAVIENKLKECLFIEQICVLGENEKFVSALIVPNFTALTDWCLRNGVKADNNEEMVSNPDVIKFIRSEINALNHNFGKVEQVKKFELLPNEWTIDTGELTPTMKVKRKVVIERYLENIKRIYKV